jgi:hypothetical protein
MPPMVRALAGDSTITRALLTACPTHDAPVRASRLLSVQVGMVPQG